MGNHSVADIIGLSSFV